MTIHENSHFKLVLDGINVWIHMFSAGFDIKSFSQVSEKIPRLKLTNFGNLTKSLSMEIKIPVIIGVYRHKVEIDISSDALKATAQVLLTPEQFELEKGTIVGEIIEAIKSKDITHGIIRDVFTKPLIPNEKILVAEGTQPIEGEDAIITYFEMSDCKPKISQDGKVNHYELNLIDNINVGEWLGQKKPATLGSTGVNIRGEEVPTKTGRDYPIRYDLRTVAKTVLDDGTEQLYALKIGRASWRVRV